MFLSQVCNVAVLNVNCQIWVLSQVCSVAVLNVISDVGVLISGL